MNLLANQKQTHKHRRQTWLPKEGGGEVQIRSQQIQASIYKTDNEQGSPVQHREVYSLSCQINYNGKKSEKELCITEPLRCIPGTNAIL